MKTQLVEAMARNILKTSLDSAKFSIIFQILFRCITFVLNAFIIRHVGQDVLGIMNVRLLLLESTLIFLSREPLIKACLSDSKSHNWAQVLNQIWLSVPISATFGFILTYIWLHVLSGTEDKYLAQYHYGCFAILVSVIIDQMTQSVVLVAQSYCFVKLKVIVDTIYVIVRTATFVILVLWQPEYAINAFSIAQVLSSIVLSACYYGFFYWYIENLNVIKKKGADYKHQSKMFQDMHDFEFKSIREFMPYAMENSESPLNKDLVILTVSFAKQSFVKQILTEGERYVMTISPVLTFSEQSMYDIVNNLGSLAARFVFRPIEESAYFYFTQMIRREVPLLQQDQKAIVESATVLSQLLKVVTSIGLIVVIFGHNYSHTLLYLYGGHVLTDSYLPTTLLKCHCFAVLLLAVNGVTECYVFATMDNRQLDKYNYLMVIFSVSFLAISYLLTNTLGPVGFILANCINMSARIAHSIHFIRNQYGSSSHRPLDGLKPDKFFSILLAVSFVVTKLSDASYSFYTIIYS